MIKWVLSLLLFLANVALLTYGFGPAGRRARWKARLSELRREFFARPPAGRSWRDVIWWWDSRRWLYSLTVLFVALFSTSCWWLWYGVRMNNVGTLQDGVAFIVGVVLVWPLFLMVAANAWYTGGWIAELACRVLLGDRCLWLGPVMLGMGLAFSVPFTILMTTPEFAVLGSLATAIVSEPLLLALQTLVPDPG